MKNRQNAIKIRIFAPEIKLNPFTMKEAILSHVRVIFKLFTLALVLQNLTIEVRAAESITSAKAITITSSGIPVRGTVTDAQGVPIPGVTIYVSGTTTGTVTDLEGNYSLSVPEGATLVFSFIGFENQS
ncbi:MAG TPA: carboxypeptidase-like regulatory domain-containing protein, partial [Cyclobacteriaceae bacterium]|nr:carboxypeptidase-like regulatory domain-containing protein [Cyclobacteriaceae bacterium]